MIKKQYDRFSPGYFYNFVNNQRDMEAHIEDGLKPYKATLAKSKYRNNYKLNVKWHDEKLYMMFVLRYS
jgi:hypothetical protein